MFLEYASFIDFIGNAAASDINVLKLKKHIRSISAYSTNNIFLFPMYISSDCTIDETMMSAKNAERMYASLVIACMSLIRFHTVSGHDRGSIEEYLQIFHQNIGTQAPYNLSNFVGKVLNENGTVTPEMTKAYEKFVYGTKSLDTMIESALDAANAKSIHDIFYSENLTDFGEMLKREMIKNEAITFEADVDLIPDNTSSATHLANSPREASSIFRSDRQIFSDISMKKSDDVNPLFFRVQVGFIIKETNEVIKEEILVGVSASVHRIDSNLMIADIAESIKRRHKFLKFVKWTTGETRSLTDLVFGLSEVKDDVSKSKDKKESYNYLTKRRVNWSKKGIKYITKNWNPNVAIVLTMNNVIAIKDTYGLDLFNDRNLKLMMEENYLLMFEILDQYNKMAHIMFDGQGYRFREYSYTSLERETTETDRFSKELFRTFSKG